MIQLEVNLSGHAANMRQRRHKVSQSGGRRGKGTDSPPHQGIEYAVSSHPGEVCQVLQFLHEDGQD